MPYEFKLPDVGEGVVEGEIVRWLVNVGDQVAEDQPMVEVMTDKATVEISSPVKGRILETRGVEGEIIAVGATLVVIEEAEGSKAPGRTEASATEAPVKKPLPEVHDKAQVEGAVLTTPAVRRLARERGIDLTAIKGSGPHGRILPEDLNQQAVSSGRVEERPAVEKARRIPYRGLRRKIGEKLGESKRSAVHYTYVEEADVTQLVELRERYLSQEGERHLTYLPFVLKAVVSGLKAFPLLNSSLDEKAGEIVLHQRYNLGIATATEEGLMVPVVRDADRRPLLELSNEINRLTALARSGKIRLEDLQGGTFTVTSLGPYGGIAATPVINFPEVAILGVHKIVSRPVVRERQIVVREMMNLSISLDHRLIDGVIGARFLHHVIRLLEVPGLLLLEE